MSVVRWAAIVVLEAANRADRAHTWKSLAPRETFVPVPNFGAAMRGARLHYLKKKKP